MFSRRIVETGILYLGWRTPIREGGGGRGSNEQDRTEGFRWINISILAWRSD
ncbi:unnamed protein product [Tuber melanosporum]|uniref:(Perigord truffle) hypothetical protein n=1 Tax=Tuber melanosporum (strain Mel28) TaxID=656061 RepID=D5GA23_TUBMM|nr:uncharacterized protein GSTUM_00003537001 [Tuber melanosporum]CAZ81366.1 unnamed protein product [Tuber melanosporum]